MSKVTGKVAQIVGAVIDVEFDAGAILFRRPYQTFNL